MGKCGGRELNYVSDVDVIFVAEPADEARSTRPRGSPRVWCGSARKRPREGCDLAARCGAASGGRQGALVRTVGQPRGLLRALGADLGVPGAAEGAAGGGRSRARGAFVDTVAPMVWTAAERPNFVADIQAMRRRVERHAATRRRRARGASWARAGCVTWSSPSSCSSSCTGGLTRRLRSSTTLVALQALSDGGYVGRDDAARLAAAYRFLAHRRAPPAVAAPAAYPPAPSDRSRAALARRGR